MNRCLQLTWAASKSSEAITDYLKRDHNITPLFAQGLLITDAQIELQVPMKAKLLLVR